MRLSLDHTWKRASRVRGVRLPARAIHHSRLHPCVPSGVSTQPHTDLGERKHLSWNAGNSYHMFDYVYVDKKNLATVTGLPQPNHALVAIPRPSHRTFGDTVFADGKPLRTIILDFGDGDKQCSINMTELPPSKWPAGVSDLHRGFCHVSCFGTPKGYKIVEFTIRGTARFDKYAYGTSNGMVTPVGLGGKTVTEELAMYNGVRPPRAATPHPRATRDTTPSPPPPLHDPPARAVSAASIVATAASQGPSLLDQHRSARNNRPQRNRKLPAKMKDAASDAEIHMACNRRTYACR